MTDEVNNVPDAHEAHEGPPSQVYECVDGRELRVHLNTQSRVPLFFVFTGGRVISTWTLDEVIDAMLAQRQERLSHLADQQDTRASPDRLQLRHSRAVESHRARGFLSCL